MKRNSFLIIHLFALLILTGSSNIYAQNMMVDGKFGISIFSSSGSSTGILLGGAIDIPSSNNLYIRPELNITSHGGTPIEMAGLVKYNIPTTGSNMQFYVDGGLGIWFFTGGPYLSIDFGGGAIFPLKGSKLSIPLDIRLGPFFSSGSSTFQIAITSGVRFSLN